MAERPAVTEVRSRPGVRLLLVHPGFLLYPEIIRQLEHLGLERVAPGHAGGGTRRPRDRLPRLSRVDLEAEMAPSRSDEPRGPRRGSAGLPGVDSLARGQTNLARPEAGVRGESLRLAARGQRHLPVGSLGSRDLDQGGFPWHSQPGRTLRTC
jgi:hypothetical protein